MADPLQSGPSRASSLVRAAQVAREAEVRQSPNGVRFATFGETGVADLDLDRILQAVPTSVAAALGANTYFFVPLALRESPEAEAAAIQSPAQAAEPAMVSPSYTEELGDAAICHRNVELGSGKRGVFISTRLMDDRFALSFEFFINVAHAFADSVGVPAAFAELAWKQAAENIRGESSLEAWESRHAALGRAPAAAEAPPANRRNRGLALAASRSFAVPAQPTVVQPNVPLNVDEKERKAFLEAAFSDAVAIYLLSLALDLDYSELRERDYPLLAPVALAARLRLVAELYPPNPGYEFAVRYRRRA